jgi:hypothetical protein
MALQLLMNELGNPELKGKGKDIMQNLNINNPHIQQQLSRVAQTGTNQRAASSTSTKSVYAVKPRPDSGVDANTTRMINTHNIGTPYASTNLVNVLSTTGAVKFEASSVKHAAKGIDISEYDYANNTGFYQSPGSSEEGEAIDRFAESFPIADSKYISDTPKNKKTGKFTYESNHDNILGSKGRKTGYVSSPSLSGSDSVPSELNMTIISNTGTFDAKNLNSPKSKNLNNSDLLSPQTPQKFSPLNKHPRATFGDDDHILSTSDMALGLSVSNSASSPLRFVVTEQPESIPVQKQMIESQPSETPKTQAATEDDILIGLKIPRLSKGIVTSMKNAADTVVNGGSPGVEQIVNEGMALSCDKFNKVHTCKTYFYFLKIFL